MTSYPQDDSISSSPSVAKRAWISELLKLPKSGGGLDPNSHEERVIENTAAPGSSDGTVLADVGGSAPGNGGVAKETEKSKDAGTKPPSTRGALSEAQYGQWLKTHPKAEHHRVGPWLPADMYQKFTKAYFRSKGFFLSGTMRMGSSGEIDEIWLNNAGNGTEFRVARDPNPPKKAPAKPHDTPYDPDEDAEDDVINAEQTLKERGAEMLKVQAKLKELLDPRNQPDFERLRKVYIDLEAQWQQHLHEDIEYVNQLLAVPPSAESKPELEDVRDKLLEYDSAFPYGDEWKGRSDISPRQGDPIRVKPPVTVKGDGPVTF